MVSALNILEIFLNIGDRSLQIRLWHAFIYSDFGVTLMNIGEASVWLSPIVFGLLGRVQTVLGAVIFLPDQLVCLGMEEDPLLGVWKDRYIRAHALVILVYVIGILCKRLLRLKSWEVLMGKLLR